MTKIKFNDAQMSVINHGKGAAMVVAGAGSGKSTVLVHRVKRLVDSGVKPTNITVVSFTNKSASDLSKKLYDLGVDGVRVGTFHSILGKMLCDNGLNVFTNQINRFEVMRVFNQMSRDCDIDSILGWISYQKAYMKRVDSKDFMYFGTDYYDCELNNFYKAYENVKKRTKTYDFDDWMIEAYDMLKKNPFAFDTEYLMVDEHQDSNVIQNALIKEMCSSGNILVVGDYRQSIYGFRGAEPKYFMDFDKTYPNTKIINLDNNYRSYHNIVDNSNNFIQKYFKDYEHYSDSVATNSNSATIETRSFEDFYGEAQSVADDILEQLSHGEKPNEIAVLYRMNAMSSEIEFALTERGINFHVENDADFFKSKHIVPIISVLRLIEDSNDDEAFINYANTRCYPLKFVPKKIINEIEDYAYKHGVNYLEACVNCPMDMRNRQAFIEFTSIVRLLTVKNNSYEANMTSLVSDVIHRIKLELFIEDNWNTEEAKNRIDGLRSIIGLAKRNNDIQSLLNFVSSNKMNSKRETDDCVKLMSIHRSKGLEFNSVFVIGLHCEKFPHNMSDIKEEARLFYVATTRPKKFLQICEVGSGNVFIDEYLN